MHKKKGGGANKNSFCLRRPEGGFMRAVCVLYPCSSLIVARRAPLFNSDPVSEHPYGFSLKAKKSKKSLRGFLASLVKKLSILRWRASTSRELFDHLYYYLPEQRHR